LLRECPQVVVEEGAGGGRGRSAHMRGEEWLTFGSGLGVLVFVIMP